MYSNKTIQIAIFIFVATMVRPLYAGCSAFDFEKSKADIPIIVAGTVLSSEEITSSPAAEATKSDPYILDHEGKEVKVFSSNNIIKEHKFSFKITKTEKGYLKEGEVIHFKYRKSNFACPSTQTPKAKEKWQLNIADIDRDNLATAYGVSCSRLGFKIKK